MKAFRVAVSPADEDLATTLLWEAGTAGIEVTADGPHTILLAYFDDPPGAEELRGRLLAQVPIVSLEEAAIPDVDWAARFRETFRAFRAGSFLVAPPWDAGTGKGPDTLIVDPGRAFGTGTHESTRLCLGILDELSRTRSLGRVADIGCGTGILAIAALRRGAVSAVAVDNDTEATAAARHHARLNDAPLHVVLGDAAQCLRAGAFDLVLANIAAPLLMDRRRELVRICRPGGVLVLSGLLGVDVRDVREEYAGEGSITTRSDGEWAALTVEIGV